MRARVILESQRPVKREPFYLRFHRARTLQEARRFAAANLLN